MRTDRLGIFMGGKGDSNLSLSAVLALIDRVLIDLTLAVEDVPLLGFTGKKIIYSSFHIRISFSKEPLPILAYT